MSEEMIKIAMLFPGQGVQYVGMGKDLHDNHAEAARIFEEAGDILGFDIKRLCFEGPEQELTKTGNLQPAILTISYASYRVYLKQYGIEPLYCLGQSLGEYSALTCSQAIAFPDALRIVRKRGQLMQEAVELDSGSMAAIQGIDYLMVEEACQKISQPHDLAVVSNYNAQNQVVISGHRSAVSQVCEQMERLAARVVPLKVSAPFHSPLMAPAAEQLKVELEAYTFHNPKYLVISNVTGKPYSLKNVKENLYQQMVMPVHWLKSMNYIRKKGIHAAVDIGPNNVVKNLMAAIDKEIEVYSFEKEDDVEKLNTRFSLMNFDGHLTASIKCKFINDCLAYAMSTKNENDDERLYQSGVVEPYRIIFEKMIELETEQKDPTIELMKDAFAMLQSVLQTKKVGIRTQLDLYEEILNEYKAHYLFVNTIRELKKRG